ncbi:MAG: ABC transporter substrate-binding protein [Firmicutes bacterium]|nr:ABC transporter substrate-binding protein [Bacillota bacterium]
MSKRTVVLLLLVVLVLASVFVSATGAEKKKIVVGFAQVGAESAWRMANTESIISEAKKRGVELIFVDCQQLQTNQIKALRSFIERKVDVIGFSPIVTTGWEEVLREAKQANIPVILTDRGVDCADDSLWVTLIGSDFVEEGRRAARWLAEKMNGKANIVELQGTIGSAPTIDRKKGFEEVIANYPEMKIIMSKTGDFTRSKGKEVMEEFLKAEGDRIDVLFSHNDDMAIGAIQAIEAYGLRPGVDIIIVSVDAIRAAFEAMIEGKLNCTVECNPLLGRQFFDAVEAIMAGEPLPKRIIVEEGVFPQEVARDVLPTRRY